MRLRYMVCMALLSTKSFGSGFIQPDPKGPISMSLDEIKKHSFTYQNINFYPFRGTKKEILGLLNLTRDVDKISIPSNITIETSQSIEEVIKFAKLKWLEFLLDDLTYDPTTLSFLWMGYKENVTLPVAKAELIPHQKDGKIIPVFVISITKNDNLQELEKMKAEVRHNLIRRFMSNCRAKL